MIPTFWRDSLAGLCALLVGIGIARFGYTPLIPVLIQHRWLDAGDAAYLGATNLAGYVGGSLLAAWLSRLVPPARLAQAAMAVTAASLLACSLPWGFAWLAPWRFLAGFTGGLLMVAAVPVMLARAPVALRARSNGIVFTGVGIGVIASGTLVPALADRGPAAIWLGMAAVTAVLAVLTWRQWAAEPAADATAPAIALAVPARYFTRPVALLLVAYMLDCAAFVPHTVFWADFIARGLGRGIEAGGFFWIFFGLGAMCGPVLAGLVAERLGFYRSMTA
ncbi:YbfB/YjiJ family MFS transporter, partial [Ferrovibrio sp.]